MKKLKLIVILFFGVFVTQSTAQSTNLESLVFEAKYEYCRNYQRENTIIIIINGIEIRNKGNIFDKIDANDIEGLKPLKAQDARDKYGDRAFVGVLEITLKKK